MSGGRSRNHVDLFVISFVCLFVEIMLIRWVSMEVRIFAYIHNLVLLACFLGFGVGCFRCDRPIRPLLMPVLLALLVVAVEMPYLEVRGDSGILTSIPGVSGFVASLGPDRAYRFHFLKSISVALSSFDDTLIWYGSGGFSFKTQAVLVAYGLTALLALFAALTALFYPLGQILGRSFNASANPISAYSLNIVASLLGIWTFSLLSMLYAPPWVWFLCGLAPYVWFMGSRRQGVVFAGLVLFIVGFSFGMLEQNRREAVQYLWSPYQKLVLHRSASSATGYTLTVNNVEYMDLLDLSDAALRAACPPDKVAWVRGFNQYDLFFRFHPAPEDVLILGAGGGNNVAGAIRNHARRIDAVEIDPGIVKLGTEYHPEHPHDHPEVNIIVDDARAWLRTSTRRYDVIVMGLLDSHTLGSSYSNVRLDHYVYTRESFEEARLLLKDGGVLLVTFAQQRPWIGARLRQIMHAAFGADPIVFRARPWFDPGGHMFVIGTDMAAVRSRIERDPDLSAYIRENPPQISADPVETTTDDWPYLYLERRQIPTLHLSVMGVLLLLLVLSRRTFLGGGKRIDYPFFFLGGAFLLLEFQNISKAALLFGTTWLVNAIIISAILLLALLANLYVRRVRVTILAPYYAVLLASLLGLYVMPLDLFNTWDYIPKAVVVSLIMNVPIFFAGIIFATSFVRAADRGTALGSNLFGAACGGLLEVVSFVTGIRFLLLIVMAIYSCAWLSGRGAGSAAAQEAA